MKLYKEVLIESAEQAEALPEGVVVIEDREGLPNAWAKSADVFLGHGLVLLLPREVIGMQALVPIEAEEDVERHWCSFRCPGPHNVVRNVYRTPWEEA